MKVNKPYFPYLLLGLIISGIYYKFFIFGKIPFPGDLLVASYSPWFDYYKIPVQNPLISDVFSLLFIWKHLAIDQLKNLQWPLWNPYSFTGTPLLANYQSAVLFPLNILLFLPKYWGWGMFIFSQTLVAALGMYLLLSSWLPSKLARLTGSIIFALAGLMTTWTEFGTAVWAISFLPVSLFSVERYSATHQIRYPLILILTQGLTILAGNPQVTVYTFAVISFFVLVRSYTISFLKTLTSIFPLFLALAFSLFLSAPQLLPTFELVRNSIRTTESYTQQLNFGLLPFADLLKFFAADFFGNPVTANYWGFLNYFETSGFVGSLTLPLLLFSIIFLRKNRIAYFFFFLFIFSLILSFDNPLSRFLYSFRIPFLTQSYASRLLFITTFSISILSAFTINQIKEEFKKNNNFLKCVTWSWATFTGILIGALASYNISGFPNVLVAMRNSLFPFIQTSAFLLIYIIIIKINFSVLKRHKSSIILAVLFAIITLDLSRYFLKFNPFVSKDFIFPQTLSIDFLQKQTGLYRIGREHGPILPPNTWAAYKLQSIEGYDVLHLLNFSKIINHINAGNLLSGGSSRYEELTNYQSPFIDASGVKYFIALGRDKDKNIGGDILDTAFEKTNYKKVFKDGSAVILENPNALPKTYYASSFFVAPQSQIENIIAGDSTFDPRITAALSVDLGVKTVTATGSAQIISYSQSEVKIKTNTQTEEVLILADQYDTGWQAKVDGQNTPVSPANLIFRAIRIPAGTHKIVFNYYPRSFDLGLKIALVAIAITTLTIFVSVKIKRF